MLILSLDLKEKKAYVDPMVCCFEMAICFLMLWSLKCFALISHNLVNSAKTCKKVAAQGSENLHKLW